jgi:iron complex outermembrane receptor protein
VPIPSGSNPSEQRRARGGRSCALKLAIALCLASAPARGQDEPPDPEATDDEPGEWDTDAPSYETVVRDYRIRPTDETTTIGETIEVDDEARSARSVSEVLSEAVGVQVRQLGGLGSYGAASIRGSTPGQVPIYLDGVLLNAGGFPTVDLGDLSLDTLETIEVYRGGGPVHLGLAGIGGAIDLKTRALDEPRSELALSCGSWSTARLLLLRTDRIGELTALGILTAQGSEGDFEYLNRNGTLFTDEDDRIERRRNNDHVAYGALIKLDRPIGDWSLSAVNDLHLLRRGVPGIDSVPTERAELRTMRDAVSLRLGGPLGDPDVSLHLDASYLTLGEELTDLDNEIGIGFQRTISRAHTVGGGALLHVGWRADHASDLRLAGYYDRFGFEELVADVAPDPSTRVRIEAGAEHGWRIADLLDVVPSLRLALHRSRFAGGRYAGEIAALPAESDTSLFWSPALGLRLEIVRGLFLRANGGRYFRAPDLSELYGDRGAVIGNPGLDPEMGYNADAGVTWIRTGDETLSLVRLDAAWFGSWASDLIVYVQNSQSTIRPENVDAARILGAEAGIALRLVELVGFTGNYTYLNAINRSDRPYHNGKFLPGRPAHEAYVKLEVGQQGVEWGTAIWLDADFAGQSYLDQANLKKDSLARMLFGIGLRLERPPDGLTLTFQVKNMFDRYVLKDAAGNQHPLRDFEGFPLPGRTILVTLHWKG